MNTGWDFIQFNVQYPAKRTILILELPEALSNSRQMEGNIIAACAITFIKKHTKAVLTVTYFLRKERKLSKKAEFICFR